MADQQLEALLCCATCANVYDFGAFEVGEVLEVEFGGETDVVAGTTAFESTGVGTVAEALESIGAELFEACVDWLAVE